MDDQYRLPGPNEGGIEPINTSLFFPGNNLWTLRSKHGRDKIFSSPQAMASAFVEYVEHTQANPFIVEKQVVVAQELATAKEKRMMPLTWSGFAVFCGAHTNFFSMFKADKKRCTPDFKDIIDQIESIMFNQKFSGAAAGIFNANIISRDLGLIDKSQRDVRAIIGHVPLSKEEAKNINEALEDEF